MLEIVLIGGTVLVMLVAAGLRIDVGFDRPSGDEDAAGPPAVTTPREDGARRPGTGPAPAPDRTEPPVEEQPADVTVQILDGGGGEERVGEIRALLVDEGFRVVATSRARVMDDILYFTDGYAEAAQRAAELIGFERVEPMESLPPERRLSSSVMLHVIVGAD